MLDRDLIDPDGLYPSQRPRWIEQAALEALQWRSPHRLTRTRDIIEIRFPDANDEDWELMILFTPEGAELRLPSIEWTMGSYGPARSSNLWRRLPAREVAEAGVADSLNRLRNALRRRLRRCKYCDEKVMPYRMTGDACHGCASEFERVVY